MAKIILSKDAPEGQALAAVFGTLSFDAGKAKSFETDDVALLEEARRYPFFEVEDSGAGVSKADASAYLKDETRLATAVQDRADALGDLSPYETPLPVPLSLADLDSPEETSVAALAPTNEPEAPSGGSN